MFMVGSVSKIVRATNAIWAESIVKRVARNVSTRHYYSKASNGIIQTINFQ